MSRRFPVRIPEGHTMVALELYGGRGRLAVASPDGMYTDFW